ncbi:MAG: V-type ATP synthase subunit D [Anaerolineales bacterium]
MPQIPATRAEFKERKERLELAREGQSMLEEKRAALMQELQSTIERVMTTSEDLAEAAETARHALAVANSQAGLARVRSAALAARDTLVLESRIRNIMGLRVPHYEAGAVLRPARGRGYGLLDTPLVIDVAAGAFERQVEAILELAESELRLKKLAKEIQSVTRRVNALEQVLIPRIQEEMDYIGMKLKDREREEHYRLRLVKSRLEAANR